MFRAFLSRLPFLFAAALVAAAVGDLVVESAANTGVFGAGYDDNNHLSVVPTLLAGCFGWLTIAVWRAISSLRASSGPSFAQIAADISAHPSLRDLFPIFTLQIAAVFCMESAEQLVAAGTLPSGISWLGGPIALSLVAHACIGAACAFALAALMRAFSGTLTSALRIALKLLSLVAFVPAGDSGRRRIARTMPRLHAPLPFVRQSGGRAPPLPSPSI